MIQRAVELGREGPDAEERLWFFIRDRKVSGFKFMRQVAFGTYIVDFACSEARLIVEIDGDSRGHALDTGRTAFLESTGYRVIRFDNDDVRRHIYRVLDAIDEALWALPSVKPAFHLTEREIE